jgi:hypothetical protein
MPVVFKSEKQEPITITKQGDAGEPTLFIFVLSREKQRQARMQMYAGGERSAGAFITEIFRRALVGWDNLIDEAGHEIPFSIEVRDSLVNDTDIFTDADVFTVIGPGPETGQKKTAKEKKHSNAG